MTVDTAHLLARYNAQANQDMNLILSTLTEAEWTQDRGGYFPSFQALAGHLYVADVNWLVRFTGLRPFQAVKGEPFDFPPSFGKVPFGGFAEYRGLRESLDKNLQAFVQELTDEDLTRDLSYRSSKGEPFTRNFGGLVLHMFNHQTHHRGSISMLLDQMKKANDYSNLMSIL